MPEISALPAAPAVPAIAGVAPATPQAPRDALSASADASAPSFLTQLQSALTSLGLLAPTSQKADAPADLPAADEPEAAATDDELPEVLAALGFLPVPMQLPMVVADAPVASEASSSQPVAIQTGLAPAQRLAPFSPARAAEADTAQLAPTPTNDALAQAEPTHDQAPAPKAAELPDTLLSQMTPVQSAQPQIQAAAQMLAQQTAPAPRLEQAPETTTDASPRVELSAAPVAVQPTQTTTGQTTTDSDGDSDQSSGEPTTASDADAPRTDAPTQVFATTTAAVQRVETPNDVKPAHVVSQIAHQGDLYRLPGGRGVRIQLNPDDLGGVGVTIKYGVSGGLELHVTAEHAATAELVQSGWNDLRDALSLQGIAPERLIMSVSSPGGASLSDSQGGSYRSDAGTAGFTFGQDSSPHRDNNESRASRGWSGFDDAPAVAAEDVRPGSAVSNSRIDYRA